MGCSAMKLFLVFLLYATALSIGLGRRGLRSAVGRVRSTPDERPTRVLLIVGATGGTGRQLVEQALERGHTVTALARDPSALRVEHPRLTVIRGNVLDYRSVEAAVRGQDAVVSALGHKRFFGPTRILSEGTRNVLRAMETHRVQRFVCETALGIGDSAGRMGVYYTFFVVPISRKLSADCPDFPCGCRGFHVEPDDREYISESCGGCVFVARI